MGAVLSVVQAGAQVTVQDAGRPGLMRFGVPASGPMDRAGHRIAHAALGNPQGTAGIEVSRGGLLLECQAGAVTVAVAGGGFVVEGPQGRGGSWAILHLRAGERLAIRPGPWGSWCHLAFAGTLQARRWLGSHATHAVSNLGGGALAAGDRLQIGGEPDKAIPTGAIPCPVWARPRRVLRVVPGPQDRFFGAEEIAAFLGSSYALTDAADRMGVRLRGPALVPNVRLDMPSEPILRGSVQVAGDGVATVLLADHQTTGGYPKIATVIDADLDGFVQNRPQDRVRFRAVSPEAAAAADQAARRAEALWLRALRRRLDADAGGMLPENPAQTRGTDAE